MVSRKNVKPTSPHSVNLPTRKAKDYVVSKKNEKPISPHSVNLPMRRLKTMS